MKTTSPELKAYASGLDTQRITEPTRALLVAVLSRALKDILKPTCSDLDLHKKQALHWIDIDDLDSFTSFVNICSHLDINADQFRRCVHLELRKIEICMPPETSLESTAGGHHRRKGDR